MVNDSIRATILILAGAVLLLPASCTGGGPSSDASGAISRDRFLQAYVQLRKSALSSPGEEIDIGERDRILESMGLTDQDLLTFVDVWGRNGEMMQGILQDADSILREARTDAGGDAEDPGGDQGDPDDAGGDERVGT